MHVVDVGVANYRNYSREVLQLNPGVTTFIGKNGQGKTNLVEAIAYLSTLSSHRVSSDNALIKQGSAAALIQARVMRGETPTSIEVEIFAGRANRARINRGNAKPSEILGILTSVMFAPEDLGLVRGEPSVRRTFLDELMIQLRPRMAHVKSEYEKVARQRAAMLKTAGQRKRRGQNIDHTSIDIWTDQLITLGSEITAERARIIAKLRPYVNSYYHEISGVEGSAYIAYDSRIFYGEYDVPPAQELSTNEEVRAQYEEAENELNDVVKNAEKMAQAAKTYREQEIDRGVNIIGPQRDELLLNLGTLPAKGYASHGESWSYALALRLASWNILKGDEHGAEYDPVLILDDVFAELDSSRRKRLAAVVKDAQQVLVTAAVGEDLPEELAGDQFYIESGKVVKVVRA